VRKSFFI